jgi:vanillate O-demethylase monooxygenase subunit
MAIPAIGPSYDSDFDHQIASAETPTSTHYFYAISFPRAMGELGAQLATENAKALRGPFEQEDKPFVEAVAANMGDAGFWESKPLLLSIDGAAVNARRIMERLIEAEKA